MRIDNATPDGRVGRVAIEFLLIVAGVLTALTVDAAWQGHTERVREREYLTQLHSDVLENRRLLQAALVIERGQLHRALAILAGLRGVQPIPLDSAALWMNAEPPFPWYSDPRLRDGTITALVGTGDINLIRNERVRAAMIGYQGQVRADLGEFSRDVGLFQDLASDLLRLLESTRAPSAEGNEDDVAGSLVALRTNPDAAAIFRLFRFNIEARIWYLTQMLNATDEFVAVLEPANVSSR
jgi:hypothetical protein